MARKKLVRRLPPLPAGPTFKAKDHKSARILEILRGIAVKNQTEEPQTFYSVRQVARRFRVPISTIARTYSELEDEGILTSVRGSKTLLQGLSAGRHFSVLGFIGMPAAVSSFVTLQDYRLFFVRTRRELRSRGFAVAMVLFDSPDIESRQLEKRIIKYEFDTILWYRPDTAARKIFDRLKDLGVRVIGISDHAISPIRCRYEIRRESAITAILHDWHAKGKIKSVVVVRGMKASANDETLERLLEEEGLDFEFANVEMQRVDIFIESLCGSHTKGIILPSSAASMLAFRAPEGLMKVMNHCRMAFTGGPASIPFAQVLNVRADMVIVDWQLIAERIVNELISKKAFDRTETTVFEAQAHLRAPINQYAQRL